MKTSLLCFVVANALMRKFRVFSSGGKNCVEVVNKPSVQVIFTVSNIDSAAGYKPFVDVVDQDGQVSQTWGGGDIIAAGTVVSTGEMPFNIGDQLKLRYESTNGIHLDSIQVKKCTDGICQMVDVLTHDGQYWF